MSFTIARILIPSLLAVSAAAQNPPDRGDPYVLRGNPKSPDGKYEWVVRTNNLIRYELIDVRDGREVVTVNAYYPDVTSSNIQYARASGIFWNKDGTVVALDELNRRRAGHLYFFILRNGTVHEIRAENIFPIPLYADECRVVVDPGWVSGTKILVRQALKTRLGEFVSKYFTVDFTNPYDPKIQPAEAAPGVGPLHRRETNSEGQVKYCLCTFFGHAMPDRVPTASNVGSRDVTWVIGGLPDILQ